MSIRLWLEWFTKSNLLLLAMTIIISFFMMVLLIPPPKEAYKHSVAYVSVTRLSKQLAAIDGEFQDSLEDENRTVAFNNWLNGESPVPLELAKKLGEFPDADPWKNSYQFVRLEKGQSSGVFSLGRDAKTESAGNDTDDLNSWKEDSGAVYAQEVFAQAMIQILWPTAILTPLLFIVLRRSFRYSGLMKTPEDSPLESRL
jgi:hypothetical protein